MILLSGRRRGVGASRTPSSSPHPSRRLGSAASASSPYSGLGHCCPLRRDAGQPPRRGLPAESIMPRTARGQQPGLPVLFAQRAGPAEVREQAVVEEPGQPEIRSPEGDHERRPVGVARSVSWDRSGRPKRGLTVGVLGHEPGPAAVSQRMVREEVADGVRAWYSKRQGRQWSPRIVGEQGRIASTSPGSNATEKSSRRSSAR